MTIQTVNGKAVDGTSSDSISKAARRLANNIFITPSYQHVTSSVSTNTELMFALQQGKLNKDHFYVLTAQTQSSGRGQRQRTWQSPVGNVYLSLYCPCHEGAEGLNQPLSGWLSLLVAQRLVTLSVINDINGQFEVLGLPKIGVKWANDIGFYGTTTDGQDSFSTIFHKLSGILIEPVYIDAKMVGVIIGVGLNVFNAPLLTLEQQENMAYQSVSLASLVNDISILSKKLSKNSDAISPQIQIPKVQDLYQPIVERLIEAILLFNQMGNEKQEQRKRDLVTRQYQEDFDRVNVLKGKSVRIEQQIHESVYQYFGLVLGVDAQGCLQLRDNDGKVRRIFSGRIQVRG